MQQYNIRLKTTHPLPGLGMSWKDTCASPPTTPLKPLRLEQNLQSHKMT